MGATIQVQTLAGLDPDVWTDVVSPDEFNHVSIEDRGGNGVVWRTNKADPSTEKTIRPFGEQAIAIPQAGSLGCRFPVGSIPLSLRPSSGTGPVVLVWLS